jgi:dolichol-phosphate mannosyltransferase
VAFSGLPLKLMSLVGFFVALSGFLYALYVIFNAFSGNPIDGWSSIMVAVLILGGIQMIMLGVVGEYLWRNLDESRKRPLYFIEKKTQKNHE